MQTFGTPSVKAVINHKWKLYGHTQVVMRASSYLFYTLQLTVFAILYSKVQNECKKCVCVRVRVGGCFVCGWVWVWVWVHLA